MRTILLFTTILALLACKGPAQPTSPTTPGHPDNPKSTAALETPEYTLEENIGEMLLIGFRGTQVDSVNTPDVVRALLHYHVGSVILFDYDVPTNSRGRNITSPDQLRTLCQQLRAISPSLLIGIDQEGGYVSRLSTRYGFPRIPSAQWLGSQPIDTLKHYAAVTADMLASLGIDLNFAPVADVNINPACPVIGRMERCFSTDAATVTNCCLRWSDVHAIHHVASCWKHFPGHGSARGDTHKGLVDVSDTWQPSELEPYRHLPANHTMVMTAHVINRQLDPSGLPASLSPRITSLLRDTLGFNGVIVTDDLAMGAISSQYSLRQTIHMALDAGADMLCMSNNGSHYNTEMVPQTVAIIKQLVDEGKVNPQRLRQSADRVRTLKAAIANGK